MKNDKQELSEQYYVNEKGMCCMAVKLELLVVGVYETYGGYVSFKHLVVEVRDA